ncbi:DUF502 domain-containing protein [soil metagenome]
MRRIVNYFLQGLLFVVPIAVTLYVLIKSILWIDGLLPFQVPVKIPGLPQVEIPGLGLLVIFLVIAFIGFLGSRYIRNPFFAYLEKLVEKAPLTKLIYSSVKDLINAFVGEKKSFNHPVMVLVQKDTQLHRIGFITKEDIRELGMSEGMVAVYLPFSYGFNGQLVIVPRENVKMINASGTDMMKFIISGGVTEI